MVAAVPPLRRMGDNPRPDHVHVDIDQTAQKMLAALNRRCVVTILPICARAPFSPVKLLRRPARNQLNASRNAIEFIIHNQQVNMVRCNHVIENRKAIALPRFKQPLYPALPVPGKPEQKFTLMTAVGDMPYLAGNMMTVRSWHDQYLNALRHRFHPSKSASKP